MLGYFKHFFESEVLNRFEFAALSAPLHGRAVLAVRAELLQAVVYAVEENFVVDVHALRQEIAIHAVLCQLLIRNFVEIEEAVGTRVIGLILRIFTPLLNPQI